MKLTTFDNLVLPAGRLHRWAVSVQGTPTPHPTGPSENERFHLDAVRAGGSGWLAVTFRIGGDAVDLDRLRHAFTTVVNHHEVLRAHFVVADDDSVGRMLHAPGDLHVAEAVSTGEVSDAAHLKAVIGNAIVDGCSALTPASHVLAAIEQPGHGTTVICAFDHCYIDAHSLAVIAEDVASAYAGDTLRPAGSFLDHQAVVEHTASAHGDSTDTGSGLHESGTDAPAADPRVVAWGEFLAGTGWTVPEFPMDLGVPRGDFAPARIHVDTVLAADDAHTFSVSCAERGIRFYPALLACLAVAVHDLGGPARLPVVVPVHTRRTDEWARSVGWFVSNAPLVVDTDDDLDTTMRNATDALAAALPLAEIDLTTVYGTFGHQLRAPRHDVFMVSYLDYRRFDGLPALDAHHVSSDGRADTLQLWFWRDETGVHLRTRYPDTTVAHTVVTSLVADLIRTVRDRLRSAQRLHADAASI